DGTVSQVKIVPFYDRTALIGETLDTLSKALLQQILITIVVVLVMLRNLRSSLLISAMLPIGVLGTFVMMKVARVDANIMALGGIAIAIGTMVDIGIVFVENMNQHLERAGPGQNRAVVLGRAAAEVAPAVLTSVATTVVSFLPVLGLSSSELRLFAPLAYTKTFAMTGVFVLAVLILPGAALVVLRERPRALSEETPGLRRLAKSAFRIEHLRDWIFVGLSVLLLSYTALGGALLLLFSLYRLARPLLTSPLERSFTFVENALAILVVTVLLAQDWLPLGYGKGIAVNLVFVGLLIFGIMGAFRLFEESYPRLLRWVLSHKVVFLVLPVVTVI